MFNLLKIYNKKFSIYYIMKNMIFIRNMLGQKNRCSFKNIEKELKISSLTTHNNLKKNLFLLYNYNNNVKKCLNIGGDHSLSIATLSSSIHKHGNDIKVLWFDAHPDINSYEKSITKNVHGMVLNYITQIGNNNDYQFDFIPKTPLPPSNILYIGIRDIDCYEKEVINKYNISVISSQDVNEKPDNVTNKINDFIGDSKFHLSLDIDGLDPMYTPSTGTPVDNGMHLNPLLNILENINHRNRINTDIVEYNPCIGNIYDKDKTLKNLKKIINVLK